MPFFIRASRFAGAKKVGSVEFGTVGAMNMNLNLSMTTKTNKNMNILYQIYYNCSSDTLKQLIGAEDRSTGVSALNLLRQQSANRSDRYEETLLLRSKETSEFTNSYKGPATDLRSG